MKKNREKREQVRKKCCKSREKSKTKYGKSTEKVRQKYEKVSEKCNKAGEKYIVVKKSELSAEGTKREVENTPKFTRPKCILARLSSLLMMTLMNFGAHMNHSSEL